MVVFLWQNLSLASASIIMDDYFKYIYRVKGQKCSYFHLPRAYVLSKLAESNVNDDNHLLSYIKENNLYEIKDSLQLKSSYRMRYVILDCNFDIIKNFYCPYCGSDFDGSALKKQKVSCDKGDLWSGESIEFYCPEEHKVLSVRTFVS